jgi:uncharacterized protein YggE
MKKIWLGVAVVLAALAVMGLAGCTSGGALAGDVSGVNVNLNNQQQGLWVSGEGKVTAVPDVAILNLGIQARESSVAQAQAEASQAMDKVIQALKDNGVAEKDIQTQNFSIQKVTQWDNDKQVEVLLGYQVTNTVVAKVRTVNNAGPVIDAAAAAGGDLIIVNNIGFNVDDPSPYQAQAREKAVADAAAKAKQLAATAGVTLGNPTYITENSYVPGPIYRSAMESGGAAVPVPTTVPISPGELEITSNVQIAYAISD